MGLIVANQETVLFDFTPLLTEKILPIIHSSPCLQAGLFFCDERVAMKNEELLIADADYARLAALGRQEALEEELSRATVIPVERMPDNVVRMHSRVTYLDERSGERREVELVFPEEADMASGKVSVLAPVGAALLGLVVGQSIDWPFPDGRARRLRVESTLAPSD